MKGFLKNNQDAFTGGVIAVFLGFLSKMVMKKDTIPVSNASQVFLSFTTVSLAGIGANELKKEFEF